MLQILWKGKAVQDIFALYILTENLLQFFIQSLVRLSILSFTFSGIRPDFAHNLLRKETLAAAIIGISNFPIDIAHLGKSRIGNIDIGENTALIFLQLVYQPA